MATERNLSTIWTQTETNCHPTAADPTKIYNFDIQMQKQNYCNLCNCCERHRCQAYCKRKKRLPGQSECRGNFPHVLLENTIIAIKQIQTKALLITHLELLTKCNDVWLNSHCYPII